MSSNPGGATTNGPDATSPPSYLSKLGGMGGVRFRNMFRCFRNMAVPEHVPVGLARGRGGRVFLPGAGGGGGVFLLGVRGGLAGGQGGVQPGVGGGVRVRVKVRVTELVEPVLVL